MELLLLNEEKSLWNLQRLLIPNSCENVSYGKYGFVTIGEYERYLCRIYPNKALHDGYCVLDKTVRINVTGRDTYEKSDRLLLRDIEIIPQVNCIKTLRISIVFDNPQETIRWKSNLDSLGASIKELLQLFVMANNCVITVNHLDCAETLMIVYIIVHNVGNIDAGRVVDSTRIKVESVMSYVKYKQMEQREQLSKIITLMDPYNKLTSILKCGQKLALLNEKSSIPLSNQVLLLGPSGSGKRTLVRKVASDCGIVVITLDGSEATRPHHGDTESYLRDRFNLAILHVRASNRGQCILLIQNLEVLCNKPGRVMASLISLLDSVKGHPSLTIIATSNKPHLIHQAIRSSSRFHTQIYIGIPTEQERIQILKHLMSDFNLKNEALINIAIRTPGFILADLVLLIQNLYRQMIKLKNVNSDRFSEEELMLMLHKSLTIMEPSTLRGELGVIHDSKNKVNEIGGLEGVKLTLQQAILWPLLKPKAFKTLNIKQSSGVLLYGPPGCAKTSLVRNIAASCKCTFLAVSAADLYSPYVGDAEKTITNLFQRARAAAPTILFIDEIDALVGCREGIGSQERVLSSFLTEMDGVGYKLELEHGTGEPDNRVFVVAATNRPNVLDSALLRPGRLDRLIYVPAPSVNERLDILMKLTERMPLDADVDLGMISESTKLYSGADLKNLCREAALCALTEEGMLANKIKHCHWVNALEEIHPSLTNNQVKWYDEFSFSN